MRLEILLSCMNQTDDSLLRSSGIYSDTIMVNQCSGRSEEELERRSYAGSAAASSGGASYTVTMIHSPERGLSRSRNRAIQEASAELCLLCDDDEHFEPDYEEKIIRAFQELPEADIIAFKIQNQRSRLPQRRHRLNRWTVLRVASWQIAFRRERVLKSGVRFDPYMGAGSGNGAGEEVKFLRDCIFSGLKVYYEPVTIAAVSQQHSTWFHGFDEHFFYQRGGETVHMLGFGTALFYALYYAVVKLPMYRKSISLSKAVAATVRGIFADPIGRQSRIGSERSFRGDE